MQKCCARSVFYWSLWFLPSTDYVWHEGKTSILIFDIYKTERLFWCQYLHSSQFLAANIYSFVTINSLYAVHYVVHLCKIASSSCGQRPRSVCFESILRQC